MLEALLVKPYKLSSFRFGSVDIFELVIERAPLYMTSVILWELVKD